MNKKRQQQVVNQLALENFDRVTQDQAWLTEEVLLDKPQRDPQGNKQRDQRKLDRRDRYND